MLKIAKDSKEKNFYVYEGAKYRSVWFAGSELQCEVYKEAIEIFKYWEKDIPLKELAKWVRETNLELIDRDLLSMYLVQAGLIKSKADSIIERNLKKLL